MDKTEPNSDEPRDRDSMQAGFDEIFNSIMAHTADNIMLLEPDRIEADGEVTSKRES